MVPERAAYASSNALHIPHRAPRRAQSRSEKICSSCPAQKTEGECSRPVSRVLSDIAVRTVISLGVRSLVPSSSLPAASVSRRAVSRRLFGLAPIGVTVPCLSPDTRWALTPPFHPYLRLPAGGLISVALSVAGRSRNQRPGVTWRSALWSPDFPRCTRVRRDRPAGCIPLDKAKPFRSLERDGAPGRAVSFRRDDA